MFHLLTGYRHTGKNIFHLKCLEGLKHNMIVFGKTNPVILPEGRRIQVSNTVKKILTEDFDIEEFRSRHPTKCVKAALLGVNMLEEVVITDWKYPDEKEYIKSLKFSEVVTWRLFCSTVPIPDDRTEHVLDTFPTEFLVVRDQEEFRKALEAFPQYENYTAQAEI